MCRSHRLCCEVQVSACAAVTAQALHQVCAVCQSWRQIGKRAFFSQPWKSATLLCHPLQLFTTVRDLRALASHDLSPAQEVNARLPLRAAWVPPRRFICGVHHISAHGMVVLTSMCLRFALSLDWQAHQQRSTLGHSWGVFVPPNECQSQQSLCWRLHAMRWE